MPRNQHSNRAGQRLINHWNLREFYDTSTGKSEEDVDLVTGRRDKTFEVTSNNHNRIRLKFGYSDISDVYLGRGGSGKFCIWLRQDQGAKPLQRQLLGDVKVRWELNLMREDMDKFFGISTITEQSGYTRLLLFCVSGDN